MIPLEYYRDIWVTRPYIKGSVYELCILFDLTPAFNFSMKWSGAKPLPLGFLRSQMSDGKKLNQEFHNKFALPTSKQLVQIYHRTKV